MFSNFQKSILIITFLLLVFTGNTDAFNRIVIDTNIYNTDTINFNIDTSNVLIKDTSLVMDSITNLNIKLDSTKNITKIKKKKTKSELDAPVDYKATDSIHFNMKKQHLYLYNEAKIIYGDIDLQAGYIEMDMENNIVFAIGIKDSTGKYIQKPVFKQGEDSYSADEIRYNFKTKKGFIKGVIIEMEGGFIHGETTKKLANNQTCLRHGKYTTCDLAHPHFYFELTKAQVIPNDKIVSSFAYLVVADIPMPLGIPFGFFPNKKGSTSGVLIPEYGEEENRGFYFRNGGYYFVINDYLHASLTGSIYTKGSWDANLNMNYRQRYKFNGNLDLKYMVNAFGDKQSADYGENKSYSLKWNHKQDSKSRPNSNFSASVDLSSASYDKYNTYNIRNRFNTTKLSNITYSTKFPGTPFRLNANFRHSQNSTDSTVSLSLPIVSLNMSRIYPFKKKKAIGSAKWYEKIGLTYSSNMENKTKVKEDILFTNAVYDKLKYGVKHNFGSSTSMKILKYFNFTPSANYTERWYFDHIEKNWEWNRDVNGNISADSSGFIKTDTIKNEFNRVYDFGVSASFNTKVYGMYTFNSERIKAIRHVMTPTVTFSYRPNFGTDSYNYWGRYVKYIEQNGKTNEVVYNYSYYEQGIYGRPSNIESGTINFNLSNNLEMKYRNPKDSLAEDKKLKLLESFAINTSYNIAADSINWSPLTLRARTNLFKIINLNVAATIEPYAIDSTFGRLTTVNTFEYNKSGKIGRLSSGNISVGMSFKSKTKKEDKSIVSKTPYYGYTEFDIPWTFRVNYNLRYSKTYFTAKTTQTVNFTGDFSVTPKWKIGFSSGYDFEHKKITSNTSINIYRDLHCWEMSFRWIPFGFYQSYNFQINVKSSILKDLKIPRKRSYYDNF